MVDVASLCMGCMEKKGSDAVCPACGYKEGSEPESPLHLRSRTELHGQYLVGRVLGHGGFGITYLGWDLNLERKIAIKEYLPSGVAVRAGLNSEVIPFSGDTRKDYEYGLERYLDEARTVARFSAHPSIVSVLNFFRANGTAYLVMEYLEGATFERFLESNGGKTTIDSVMTVMIPVLDALVTVHQQGILHRDISPDNVYITRKWQVKVLDFGAARYALGQKSRNLSVILKEGYAPIEQYHSKGNQGPWTDAYACAATIYRALTGKVPPSSLDRMQTDEMLPPSALGVELSPVQEAAILKAIAVQPEQRFRSMQEFKDALSGVAPAALPVVTGEKIQAAALPPFNDLLMTGPKPPITVKSGSPPEQRPVSQRGPQTRGEQKTPLPKWIWAIAAGILLAVGSIAVYTHSQDTQRLAEAKKKTDLAQKNFQDQMKQLETLRLETERRDKARIEAEARLKQEEEELQRKQQEIELLKQPAQKKTAPQNPATPNNNQQPSQPQLPPAYDQLVQQAAVLNRGGKLPEAIQVNQQAIRANPNRPEAYSNLGLIALYGTGDLQSALSNYRDAIQRGGTVLFHLTHDHQGQGQCQGDLGISKDAVAFTAQNGVDNFRYARNAIQEIKENRNPFRSASADFHIKGTDGRNFNLFSATNAKPVRDMILQLTK